MNNEYDKMKAWKEETLNSQESDTVKKLRAENAKLREALATALSEYESMSDKYWDAIYPKPPSIEDYVIHKKTMRILREVLK